jgi:hypothetical protein
MKRYFCCFLPRDLTVIEKRDVVVEYLDDISPFVNLTKNEIVVIQNKIMERKCYRKDLYENI